MLRMRWAQPAHGSGPLVRFGAGARSRVRVVRKEMGHPMKDSESVRHVCDLVWALTITGTGIALIVHFGWSWWWILLILTIAMSPPSQE